MVACTCDPGYVGVNGKKIKIPGKTGRPYLKNNLKQKKGWKLNQVVEHSWGPEFKSQYTLLFPPKKKIKSVLTM
jgi:hypothetical protein